MAKLLVLCLAALSLAAQPKFEIYGHVLEAGTNHPIEGAGVMIGEMGTFDPFAKDRKPSVVTDAQGAYRYSIANPGVYLVEVKKAKYAKTAGGATVDLAILNAENPLKEFNVTMAPLTDLTGRLVDADTSQPIAGLRVWLMEPTSRNGKALSMNRGEQISDAEGRFTMGVPPGTYVLLIPRTSPANRMQKTFTKEEAEATDLGYGYRIFSGGPDLEAALPVSITAGASTDFGTHRLKKQGLYRVRVSTSGCTPGETLYPQDVVEGGALDTLHDLGTVPCGSDFLLKNMQTGRYVIQARNIGWGRNTEANAAPGIKSAVAAFDVGESNRNLALTLARGINVEGRVVVAQGSAPVPFEKLKLRASATEGILFSGNHTPPRVPDKDGRFRWENLSPGRRQLTVEMDGDFYIKQIRVHGVPIRGRVFEMAESGTLEIEIDSNPASLRGTVLNGDKPVAGADVSVVLWPLVEGGDYFDDDSLVQGGRTDAEGKFTVGWLAPGEYRIFAIAKEDVERSQVPGVWQRIVSGGERLILSRGGASTVMLKLTDPTR